MPTHWQRRFLPPTTRSTSASRPNSAPACRLRGPDFAPRTQHALRHALQRGTPSMAAVAAELAIHPRTLRRRLAEEQTSFEALCDALRYAAAREYLELTDLPMSEISAALAYASPGVFAEAFRRWSGLSPTAWRRQNHAAPLTPPAPTSRLAFPPASD